MSHLAWVHHLFSVKFPNRQQSTRGKWGRGDDPHNGFAITRSEFLISNNGSGHYKSMTVPNCPLIACLSLAIASDQQRGKMIISYLIA